MNKRCPHVMGSMLLVFLFAACGGGGGGGGTTTNPTLTPEPVTFKELLAKGMFDVQLQPKDATNTTFHPFIVKHILSSRFDPQSAIQSTAVSRTLLGTAVTITTPFDFTSFKTLSGNVWQMFGDDLAIEFSTTDAALVHYEADGLHPSKWIWTTVREEIGDTFVVNATDNVPLGEATRPETVFIADTAAYFSRLTNKEQVVLHYANLSENIITEQDLFDTFVCLVSEVNQSQLVMVVNSDSTFSVFERPINAACTAPEVTDAFFTGSWTRVTLEEDAGIEFTFPAEIQMGEYQSILTPVEFAAKAKLVFLNTGATTTRQGSSLIEDSLVSYAAVFKVDAGAVIESDIARFSLRAVDAIKTTYGMN